ncbi:MAG TPA: murein biosynthesis integral membrane protein MurJ [Tepidisphaeraceae bacterium]|jgi:putative peptidoglycan lipid II flippase
MSNVVAVTSPIEAAPIPAQQKSFLAHAKLIGLLTLGSRLLGLAREIVAAHYLGTGLVASAFTVAFTIPNLFRKLFGEGALSAAFIPLYSQAIKHEHHSRANDFAAASVNLLCAILLAITIVGEVIIWAFLLFGSELYPDLVLTLKLTAIMLPYVLLICGGAFLSGILQVHHRFAAPAAAPIILNICHIVVLGLGGYILHLGRSMEEADAIGPQTKLAYAAASVVLVAGVMQVMVLLPGLRATGFAFKLVPHFWTPQVKRMLKLTVPVAIGAGVLQLSVLLDKGIALALMQRVDVLGHQITHFTIWDHVIRLPMESGAPRRLDVAQFLYQFPLGVFAIALATAIFPGLSADALDKDRDKFKRVLRQGIEATIWEGLPASLGLILVRDPAIRLLFQHGQISAHDADLIGQSVLFYAGAIWAFSMLQIINRAYYAIHDTFTPVIMSVINIALNLIVELPLLWWMGEPAMAVGTLVSFAVQAVVMLWMLDHRVGGLNLKRLATPTLKMLLATAVMGVALVALEHSPLYPVGNSRMTWLIQLTLLLLTGATTYLFACWLLRVDIVHHFLPRRRVRA